VPVAKWPFVSHQQLAARSACSHGRPPAAPPAPGTPLGKTANWPDWLD